MLSLLEQLKNDNLISELNYQFARFIERKQHAHCTDETQCNLATFLAALCSYNVMRGNSTLDLTSQAAISPFGLSLKHPKTQPLLEQLWQKIHSLRPLEWQAALAGHIAFSNDPAQVAPMLFQHNRLYFYRYWQAEHRVANYLKQAVSFAPSNANMALDREILAQCFPSEEKSEVNWQKVAVATALNKNFCLISGGPGTGKTTTVARLLAALQLKQLKLGLPALEIALAAPTGKAAARLKESMHNSIAQLALPNELKQQLPEQASTLHRLLGIRPLNDLPKYNAQNPLMMDLLVVDEASMIDLPLMEKLMNALKPTTRLIMLGDKDQLASVEAGAIMGELGQFISMMYSPAHSAYLSELTGYDIQPKAQNVPAICDSLCHLRHSYRFDAHSGIGQLAAEINAKQAVKSWQRFANSPHELTLKAYPSAQKVEEKQPHIKRCADLVVEEAVRLYSNYLTLVKRRQNEGVQAVRIEKIFAEFNKVRLLSALRISELGAERLNQRIAEALQRARLVSFQLARENYLGKPILVTENSPASHVFSGDIGLILSDENGAKRVYFDTQTEQGDYLSLSPSRLPSYEPAYVMTVHKSQGSEFEHTLLVMPLEHSPVITKELLYTAVTRAKKHFTLFSNNAVWEKGVSEEVKRQSGLKEQLALFGI